MKVLILLYRGNPFCGGQGIYLYNLCRELSRLNVEIDVIVGPPYPDPIESWATVYHVDNLNIWAVKTKDFGPERLKRIFDPYNFLDYILTRLHIFPEMETFSLRAFFLLRKLLKKKRYDLIHDVNTLGWGLIPMKGYGIPIISTIHHPLTRDRESDFTMDRSFWEMVATILFYPLNMQRFVINSIDRVITSSKECREELRRVFSLKREKISVVYNGIDIDLFQNTGGKREERSLLFVGNTEDHKKGIHVLIEALAGMPNDITLTIVDEGPPLKLTASSMIKKFDVENRVKLTGKIDNADLIRLYSTKTILVMSSHYEGFGLPAVEAMACGTPVVATKVGALPEVMNESCGILVEPNDPSALRSAIIRLLDDNDKRKKISGLSRAYAVSNFSWEAAAKNTYEVYKEVISSYGGAV
jgi:glycosyltransferase involved in cell wall biosynthesis